VGRRQRHRERKAGAAGSPSAPAREYHGHEGSALALRGSLTAGARREYAAILAGGLEREDAWQRAVEFLFERLATRWVIAGVPLEHQRELLQRFRAASTDERAWIRDVVRAHCAANFPDLQAP
jgi:hypothetical protein